MKNFAVGIAGTAKNTGKTTTMTCIIDEIAEHPGLTLALTSIGYDGESFDNITGLPKPRVNVMPGTIVAVAEKCAIHSEAGLETLAHTNIATPLGKVQICRVISSGKVVLAGPNKRRDLRYVLDLLGEFADLTIVDGALNRIVPMIETDSLILVTGAARNPDISGLAQESKYLVDILTTPVLSEQGKVDTVTSVLNHDNFYVLLKKYDYADSIHIQGVIGELFLKELSKLQDRLRNKRLIFSNPLNLLLSGDIFSVWESLQEMASGSFEVGVEKECRLIAMTVNPYYPKYRYNSADYHAAYVDSDELLNAIRNSVSIPCYDVVKQGAQDIFSSINPTNK